MDDRQRAPARWAYRVRQFWGRLLASLRPADLVGLDAVLSPNALELFATMSRGDQYHARCVWRLLQSQGPCPSALAQAALLHDVGKAQERLGLPARVAIVLLHHWRPAWLIALADPQPNSWRRVFYVHLHHAAMGAERCATRGCEPDVVTLVRYHDSPPESLVEPRLREWLQQLQAADETC